MLSQLTDIKLKAAGIDDKDLRKSALAAFRKAGYKASLGNASQTSASNVERASSADGAADSGPSTVQILVSKLIGYHNLHTLSAIQTDRQLRRRKNENETTIQMSFYRTDPSTKPQSMEVWSLMKFGTRMCVCFPQEFRLTGCI